MGLLDNIRSAIPDDLKEKARDAADSAKAAAVDAGELAQGAAGAAADAFDKGEQSFRQARAEGRGLTDAAKEAGRGAITQPGADGSDPAERDASA